MSGLRQSWPAGRDLDLWVRSEFGETARLDHQVAALYVDQNTVYRSIPGVDCWDESRDARTYRGPHPVVAHPPCQLWTNMAGVNFIRYKGPHNRPGNDGGCFCRALEDVRQLGGVLEHPARSYAWQTFALLAPTPGQWTRDERTGDWVCEVAQSAYGHKCRKLTWLLYRGASPPPDMRWERPAGTHTIGHDSTWKRRKPTLWKKAASATPREFAEVLVGLARANRLEAP